MGQSTAYDTEWGPQRQRTDLELAEAHEVGADEDAQLLPLLLALLLVLLLGRVGGARYGSAEARDIGQSVKDEDARTWFCMRHQRRLASQKFWRMNS